jgi:hypothetical protein
MSSAEGSVTRWLGQLQAGDPDGALLLWERYFRRLVGLARKRLRGSPRRAADEEDVALSAFDSFCRSAEQGRFPSLTDRDGLWQHLVVMTARKAMHLRRDEGRQKRGGAAQFAHDTPHGPVEDSVLEQVIGREPTPELAAQMSEECDGLGGIIECGLCEGRLHVLYSKTGKGRYDCFYANRHGIERRCQGIAAACIDQLVSQQVLRALEPASLELSVRAAEDIQRERTRLAELRQQELQRARYEAQRSERHYRSVDPENRLVAGTLEKEWEKALCKQPQVCRDERWPRPGRLGQQPPPGGGALLHPRSGRRCR